MAAFSIRAVGPGPSGGLMSRVFERSNGRAMMACQINVVPAVDQFERPTVIDPETRLNGPELKTAGVKIYRDAERPAL
jgi:hypothetical protein